MGKKARFLLPTSFYLCRLAASLFTVVLVLWLLQLGRQLCLFIFSWNSNVCGGADNWCKVCYIGDGAWLPWFFGFTRNRISGESICHHRCKAQLEKSLQIVLVRDIDGETFWDAFDDAISPRIPAPTPIDKSALSTFHSIFKGRPLKKGTFIFLTWLDSSKMQVSVSSDGWPTAVDAEIESEYVTFSIFDVFLGAAPASPSLKASAASGLAAALM